MNAPEQGPNAAPSRSAGKSAVVTSNPGSEPGDALQKYAPTPSRLGATLIFGSELPPQFLPSAPISIAGCFARK
jgi:hypothetical protein